MNKDVSMWRAAWCVPVGIFSVAYLPSLPAFHAFLLFASGAIAFIVLLSKWHSPLLQGVWVIVGMAYGCLWGWLQLQHVLPDALDKSDVIVTGTIADFPDRDGQRTRFTLDVMTVDGADESPLPPLRKLLLSWYGDEIPQPGDSWQLTVRLRSLRGFANPGGFDYHGWLFSRGYSATGYVRDSSLNHLLDNRPGHLLALRKRLSELIEEELSHLHLRDGASLVKALVLGETGGISPELWRVLKRTGTVHLVIVSGLHVGMVAVMGYWLGGFLGRIAGMLGLPLTAQSVGCGVSLLAAGFYTVLAGMELPVLRAFIMTAVIVAAKLLKRRTSGWQSLGWALCLIALLDPLAVTQAGFWLSFCAVAGLVMWFVYRPKPSYLTGLMVSQWVVFVALAASLVIYQSQLSLAAPLTNLIAIPWVSVFIVPVCLLGALCAFFLPPLASFLWQMAALQLEWFTAILAWYGQHVGDLLRLNLPVDAPWFLVALIIGCVFCLLPTALGLRWPGLLLVVGLCTVEPSRPPLQLTVLDVGQGLAVVLRTRDKTLVYDTGPGYPSGFNTGEAVIAPYLLRQGVGSVDLLVVSHGDNDHAGGVAGMVTSLSVQQAIAGSRLDGINLSVKECRAGQQWQWGEVRVEVLWPEGQEDGDSSLASRGMLSENNSSCVLLVTLGTVSILLPGDVESSVESHLLGFVGDRGLGNSHVDVLVAPHHGSKTSSSTGFIDGLKPAHVVFSTGFNHHFGHPHPVVVSRYQSVGAGLWSTARHGAVTFSWSENGDVSVESARRESRRYWTQNIDQATVW